MQEPAPAWGAPAQPGAAQSGVGQSGVGQPGTGWPAPHSRPRRGRSTGRALLLIVLALIMIGLVGAAIATIAWSSRRTQDRQLATESASAKVRVENACGPITLQPGPAGIVTTEATVRYVWRSPTVTSRVEGDEVVVRVDCPTFGLAASVSLVLQVPPDGSVRARSSAGSVQAEGLSSDLDLASSAGSITTTGLTSQTVRADTSAGSVSLSWAGSADPTTVDARSSAGSVTVRVPDRPGVAYAVDADSSAGSVTVSVRTDPGSDRSIRATSSAGAVTVGYR